MTKQKSFLVAFIIAAAISAGFVFGLAFAIYEQDFFKPQVVTVVNLCDPHKGHCWEREIGYLNLTDVKTVGLDEIDIYRLHSWGYFESDTQKCRHCPARRKKMTLISESWEAVR